MYEYLDRRYALALYQVAEENNKIEEYMQQIEEICSHMESNEQLQLLLQHPEISTYRKKDTFVKLFKGRVDEEILSFLLILIDKDRILFLKEKLNEMKKIHLENQNKVIVNIKTVIPLDEEQRETLRTKLESQYKKTVIFEEEIDPNILGGIFIKIGNDVIDGTVKTRLEEMKELMLRGE